MNIPLPNFPYTRTYRFGEEHLSGLTQAAQELRKDQSEIVREAIEEYIQKHAPDIYSSVWPTATPTQAA